MIEAKLNGIKTISKTTLPVYSYSLKTFAGRTVLSIVDRYDGANPSLSLTNGIEGVLQAIQIKLGELPELIIYRDTAGEWDRLLATPNGRFLSFIAMFDDSTGRIMEQDHAIRCVVST